MSGLLTAERALIVGCGYAGSRLVPALVRAGVSVEATSTQSRLVSGVMTRALDLDAPTVPPLPPHDALFYLAPPAPEGRCDTRGEALISALDRGGPPTRSVVLVSTTGVYGDCGGAEVDECSEINPGTDRAARRVASETVWRAACARWTLPLAVLRVAGIYGPGRLPVSRIESGKPVLVSRLAPLSNRIHVDDLVTALQCVVGLDETVDVADGTPLPLSDFYHALADALGRPRLPETRDAEKVPVIRAGFGESRRVPAKRLRDLLGVLRYPDVVSGLRASVLAER